MSKGLFIMLEGTDGSGKSLQTDLLVEHFSLQIHLQFPYNHHQVSYMK